MGVAKLWQLVEEAEGGTLTSLPECSGQSWAVDLSAWIVHGHTAGMASKNVSGTYTMIRTVFYRALFLLKHGIQPVIVLDGKTAPEVKSQTLQDRSKRTYGDSTTTGQDRVGLQAMSRMCQLVMESLGLQVITSSGEGEKTCALLNCRGIVDACLCEDSDIFLYGAKTVYRKLDLKDETVEQYSLQGIEENLELTRKDLVVLALLSGCDYGDGVKSVGPKKVVDLIRSIKKYSDDVLTRVCGWRDNEDLIALEEQRQRLISMKKSTHCTVCQHPGSKQLHEEGGCCVCGSSKACRGDGSVPCTCDYHELQQHTAPYTVELVVRDKAIKQKEFPNMKLVEEFTEDSETFSFSSVKVTLPQWEVLAHELHLSQEDLMRKMIPVLVHMHMHGTLHLPDAQPICILRNCKRNFVACYQVLWERFAFDKWTPQPSDNPEKTPPTKEQGSNNPYAVDILCEFFAEKYPELVETYAASSRGKKRRGKRYQADSSRRTLEECFKVKKRLFEEDKSEDDKNGSDKNEGGKT